MTAKRPALIFDFGNVLSFFDYDRIGVNLGKPLGMTGREFIEHARASGFSPLHMQYERGKISSESFSAALCRLVGIDVPHADFVAAWEDIFTLNAPVAEMVAELKGRGYPLVLGSNTNEIHAAFFQREFAEALAPFDRLVFSHEVGHMKPAREFYLACAEAAGADPAECVFIDDLPENVQGAKDAGLRAILFTGVDALRRDLIRQGVDIK